MSIQAVVFDVGGVLSRQTDPSHFSRWAERLKMPESELAYLIFENEFGRRATVGAASQDDIWRYVRQQLNLSAEDTAALQADCRKGHTWDQGLLNFVRDLRPHYKTAVLSDAWPEARVFLAQHLTPERFDLLGFSYEEGLQKPDPEIFRRLLVRLGVTAQETVFVDDRPRNVDGACQLGMHGLLFSTTEAIQEQIRTLLQNNA